LHRLAHDYMARERPGHTLQTPALLNEAYLRLVDSAKPSWQNRAHFFAVSAQVMGLRFFGGLSVEETAEVLKVSPETVLRDWKFAKSWLRRELSKEKPVGA
jgi:DNA-directed RNA polymerase specialized sigma24 family protein